MSKAKKKGTQKKVSNQKNYDLACGNRKLKGYIGVDITTKDTEATVQCNLYKDTWPIPDNSADNLYSAHFVEHIPHGDGFNDPFFHFFDEAWRVLKPGGLFTILTPYYTSIRAFQDPTHQRFITDATYMYLHKDWRVMNKLEHYPIKANFSIERLEHSITPELHGRATDAIQWAVMHQWNMVDDLHVMLKKLP